MFGCKISLNCFFSFITKSLLEQYCLVVFTLVFVFLSRSPFDLFANVRTVSSANITVWQAPCNQSGRLFVSSRKSTRPTTDPYGTPFRTTSVSPDWMSEVAMKLLISVLYKGN